MTGPTELRRSCFALRRTGRDHGPQFTPCENPPTWRAWFRMPRGDEYSRLYCARDLAIVRACDDFVRCELLEPLTSQLGARP